LSCACWRVDPARGVTLGAFMDELQVRKTDVAVINVHEVAELLGVCVRSVWRMSQNGQIPGPIRLVPRILRWRLADLREHLDRKAGGDMAVSRVTSGGRGARR
jgi:predicted DNA-binding transcriptional regulator AlpA